MESWSCKLCSNVSELVNVTYIDNTRTSIVGFVGYQPQNETIFVVFRCTQDFINYFEDVSYLQVPYLHCKGCKVHVGFYESWKSVENKLHAAVQKLITAYPKANIVVVGHSLGGAVATLTALELQMKYNKVSELHTFGAPRVGDAFFAEYLDTKLPNTFRVIHYKDLSPHLPF